MQGQMSDCSFQQLNSNTNRKLLFSFVSSRKIPAHLTGNRLLWIVDFTKLADGCFCGFADMSSELDWKHANKHLNIMQMCALD